MKRSALVMRLFVFALVLMPVSAVMLVWAGRERIAETRRGALPVFGQVTDFSLVESSGKPTSLADLRGRVWVAGFILTRCSGQCPIITHNMLLLQKLLPAREDVRLVSVSVDPEHDTPQVLAAYAVTNGVDRSGWWFLTGSRPAMEQLVRETFKLLVDASAGTDEEPVMHSAKLVLVDRVGQIRGYYDGNDVETMKKLARDVKRLVAVRS
ncbi:MAG: SCO family protein [Verrucomicrobiota bacterium]